MNWLTSKCFFLERIFGTVEKKSFEIDTCYITPTIGPTEKGIKEKA